MREKSRSSGVTKAQDDKSDLYRIAIPLFNTNRVMLRCPLCGDLFSENQSALANDSSYVVTLDLNHICPGCRGEISRIRAVSGQKREGPPVEYKHTFMNAPDNIQLHYQNNQNIRRSPLLERDSDEIHCL